MIESSDSYKNLKSQIQDSIDFVVLCCHAVPSLKAYMKAVEYGSAPKLPDPDHFSTPLAHQRLSEITMRYRKQAGKFLILSTFSYFEAYIYDVLKEIFEFHGGKDTFIKNNLKRRKDCFNLMDLEIENNVRQLRDKQKKGKELKYIKLKKELINKGYLFPSNLFSTFGITRLNEILEGMRAHQIPDIIKDVIGLEISEEDATEYHKIREIRNKIAHGKIKEVDLKIAIDSNKFLRKLAVKVDEHLVKHFFIIEIPL